MYNLFAVVVKLVKMKGKIWQENTEKNMYITAWNLLPKKSL